MSSMGGGSDGALSLSSGAASLFAMPGLGGSELSGMSGPERAPLTTDDDSDTSTEQMVQQQALIQRLREGQEEVKSTTRTSRTGGPSPWPTARQLPLRTIADTSPRPTLSAVGGVPNGSPISGAERKADGKARSASLTVSDSRRRSRSNTPDARLPPLAPALFPVDQQPVSSVGRCRTVQSDSQRSN